MFPGVHVLEVWAQYIDVKKLTFKMRWYQKGSNLIIGLLNWLQADSIWRVGCYESELDLLAPSRVYSLPFLHSIFCQGLPVTAISVPHSHHSSLNFNILASNTMIQIVYNQTVYLLLS